MAKQILLIDPELSRAEALKIYLERMRLEVGIAQTCAQTLVHFDQCHVDMVLVMPYLEDGDITSGLRAFKTDNPLLQIIVFCPRDKMEKAMDDMGNLAINFLELPLNAKALDIAIRHARKCIATEKKLDTYAQKLGDLHSAQNLFQQLFDEVPCYISVQSRDLRLTAANAKFKKDFGNEIGCYCFEIYKHRTSPCPDCPVVGTFETGESHQTEEIVTSKSGKQYNVLTQTAPIYNANGEISQVMEMSTNITQIRQLQDHLSSLGLMLGSMSHGVKGMLTALDGGIYQLETGIRKGDSDRVIKASEQIKQMADRIKKMVLEILYYAKSRELQYQTMDVAGLAATIVAAIAPLAEKNEIRLDVDVPDALGSIEIDPNWMQAALVNFAENAVDACRYDPGKKEHRVGFRAWEDREDTVCFSFEDNGMGMDQETRDKMFTLFFTSKGSQGTGLGLFIANRVIQHHGGNISVETRPGQGSCFRICLPRHKPETRMINFMHHKESHSGV